MPNNSHAPAAAVLTLLHTNDLHGRAYVPDVPDAPPSGLARLAPVIRRIRAQMPHVILLDGGDIGHGTPEEKESQDHPLLAAMNTLGYDAATVGNHEFDFGQPRLRRAMAFANFPFLSANVVDEDSGKPWNGLLPSRVLTRGDGVRVGIFGLTTPTTVTIEWPRTLEGVRFTDPHEAARRCVADLRGGENPADVVVCLSHLGYPADRELATVVSGIDVILGAHTHTVTSEQVWIGDTLILQTGCFGRTLSRVDLLVEPSASPGSAPGRLLAVSGRDGRWWGHDGVPAPIDRPFPNRPLLPPDPDEEDAQVLAAYLPLSQPVRERLSEVLTMAAEPLPAVGAAALGDLLADAVRAQTGADIALAASSQIAPAGLPPGPVTVGDLYALLPNYTRQHLVVARAPGARIADTLRGIASAARAAGGPLPVHLSGATQTADGTLLHEGKPLLPEHLYTVAAAAHVIQDYLYAKPGVEILADDVLAPTVRDAAIHFLRGRSPLRNSATKRA